MAILWPKNSQKMAKNGHFWPKTKNFFFFIDSTPYWLVPPKIWIFSLKNCWLCKVYRNKPEKQTAPLAVLAILSQSNLAVFLSINLAIFANFCDQILQFLLFCPIKFGSFYFFSINLAFFANFS